MTNKNKALGSGLETRVVKRARDRGLKAARQPGSGVFKDYPNDVVVRAALLELLVECKVRSRHPSYIELQEWLESAQENAKHAGMSGAVLTYNVKGSRVPRVLLDLDLLLDILALLDTYGHDSVTALQAAQHHGQLMQALKSS